MGRSVIISACCFCAIGLMRLNAAAPPRESEAALPSDAVVGRIVGELASDDFASRDSAQAELMELATSEAAVRRLAQALASAAAAKPDDWELRLALIRLRGRARDQWLADVAAPQIADIEQLLEGLNSDRFALREASRDGLMSVARSAATAAPLMLRLLHAKSEDATGIDVARDLDGIWTAAWSTWLLSPFKADALPRVAVADIDAAIDQLAEGAAAADAKSREGAMRIRQARRMLSYLLARPDVAELVAERLENRYKTMSADRETGPFALDEVAQLYFSSKPAMVAEFWEGGRHVGVQHLILGVPNKPDGAEFPSLFDRCDDRTAHCLSGNNLKPGDWPVGVFFPHPSAMQPNAQFHLKNLPTARARFAYEAEVPMNVSGERQQELDRARRREITKRTCERWLEAKHRLTAREFEMLHSIDPEVVSEFAASYLATVADERLPNESPSSFGNGSSHGEFCYQLSQMGTSAAGPALAKAIEARQILPPIEWAPYRMDWLALLVLSERTAWPRLDDWLASQLDNRDPISIREPQAAEAGASAAALLLRRHGRSPSEFSLERHVFDDLIDLENPCYRFSKPEGHEEVARWWIERKSDESKNMHP